MKFDIVRAWKDENYRQSLSDEQLSQLPENPAGEVELTDADLESVYGGGGADIGGWGNNGGDNNGCGSSGYGNNGCGGSNGWGGHGNHNRQQNSTICSIICSHDCDINVLDLLNLGQL